MYKREILSLHFLYFKFFLTEIITFIGCAPRKLLVDLRKIKSITVFFPYSKRRSLTILQNMVKKCCLKSSRCMWNVLTKLRLQKCTLNASGESSNESRRETLTRGRVRYHPSKGHRSYSVILVFPLWIIFM